MDRYILSYRSGSSDWAEYPVVDVQHAIRLVKELNLSTSLTQGAVGKYLLEVVDGNFSETWRDKNGKDLSEVIASYSKAQRFFLAYEFYIKTKSLTKELIRGNMIVPNDYSTHESFLSSMQEIITYLHCGDNSSVSVSDFYFASVVPLPII